jgi:predicted transcriptional regulator
MVTLTRTATVAENVSTAIKEAGSNPHSIADTTGIPYQTLLRRLRGITPFNIRELDLIANAIGKTTITEFLDDAA